MRCEEEGRRDFLAVFTPISVAPATGDSFLSLSSCAPSPLIVEPQLRGIPLRHQIPSSALLGSSRLFSQR